MGSGFIDDGIEVIIRRSQSELENEPNWCKWLFGGENGLLAKASSKELSKSPEDADSLLCGYISNHDTEDVTILGRSCDFDLKLLERELPKTAEKLSCFPHDDVEVCRDAAKFHKINERPIDHVAMHDVEDILEDFIKFTKLEFVHD